MKLTTAVLTALLLTNVLAAQQAKRDINTIRQKLKAGKQVVGGTIQVPDPDTYCAMANSGFDYLWIEMQHSPLSYQDVAHMIMACKGAPALPFVRIPDATEGDIQKAADMGALGIIIPMVDDVEKVKNAIKYAMFPPKGKRSQGAGYHSALYGADYRQISNDNMMIIAMIESPAGAKIAAELAAIPEVDVVFVAATDLSSFSGYKQGDKEYEAIVDGIVAAVNKAGKKLGGPLAWKSSRKGYAFFQGPTEVGLLRTGVKVALGDTPASESKLGVAPLEGSIEKK